MSDFIRNSVAIGSKALDYLENEDSEIYGYLCDEFNRQRSTLQLIASENFASPAVLAMTGSVLTNKYAEGYPQKRYYGGNQFIDEIEDIARERAKVLFSTDHVNVQPHSGSSANLAVYQALLNPGDTVLAMRLDQGGHLTHGAAASVTGKMYNFQQYGLTPRSTDGGERIDFDYLRDLAKTSKPKLIVAGATAYPREIDPTVFRAIADEVGALLMFDSAHPMGLIAAGVHVSPVGIADVVTFTTHKTLRGPRGGAILCKHEFAKKIDSAVFPGLQGGPLEHVVAAKAIAFKEASTENFVRYGRQIKENSSILGETLIKEGFRLVSNGTDNHLVLVDLRDFDADLDGKIAQESLDSVGITCNRNQIPDDPRKPLVTSGLRLGTAAMTTSGMKGSQMSQVGSLIARTLRNRNDENELKLIKDEVNDLCSKFDPYPEGEMWPGMANFEA